MRERLDIDDVHRANDHGDRGEGIKEGPAVPAGYPEYVAGRPKPLPDGANTAPSIPGRFPRDDRSGTKSVLGHARL
jgi:hypothetical protein